MKELTLSEKRRIASMQVPTEIKREIMAYARTKRFTGMSKEQIREAMRLTRAGKSWKHLR